MCEEPLLPAELLESVRDVVGRSVKLILTLRVQLEVKGDKVEPRLLAAASHRVFLLTTQIPSKVEQSFSYLELQGVSSKEPTQLVLDCDRGPFVLRLSSEEQVDRVITHIGICLQRICPDMPPGRLMGSDWSLERASVIHARWAELSPADLGPCGGFSHQYRCVCDYLGLPYREEVQWDVDTIYLTQDTRELNLQDFVHLDHRDLVPIIGALEYNQWFTKLSTKDYKLPADVCEQILRVLSRSGRLEELQLDNAGLRSDFAQKLAAAFSQSPAPSVHTLSLNNNHLEDKGVSALGAQLANLPLKQLSLSRTSMSSKGANSLFQSLCGNSSLSSSLTVLDLSGNNLRDDAPNLHRFLSSSNHLEHLNLSHCDVSMEQVCASLLKGSAHFLSVLNMSKSLFSHRKLKDVPPSFKQFFNSSRSLSWVGVAGTRIPLEALKSLLLGLGCNPNLSDVTLDLSGCELRSGGCQVLEGCIAEIPNISSLDVSDNGLDMDLTTLLVWLAKNRSIRHLSLGKNFHNIKSKNVSPVLDNLVHLIQEDESPLTSLSLADSRLKGDLSILLNALGSNTSLTALDISGNAMGDMGAKMLAKALQINTKLRTLVWDRNNVSAQGLQDVALALEKNYTIRFMPVPIMDAAQALKSNPEKTADALLKMEQFLLRNHETRKYLQEQAYRLQQGIVTTTTQQMMDRMCVKVQDHLNSLKFTDTRKVLEDMTVAENLMQDARNSKTLLPSLYHLSRGGATGGGATGGGATGPCVGAVLDQLQSMAGELAQVIDQQLQRMLGSMVDAAEAVCPHVMKRSGLRQELLEAAARKSSVPQSFITSTLLDQSGGDILNKISEVKLSVASFLSDRIVDDILESLSSAQHTLADHLSRKDVPLLRTGVETEVLDESLLQPEDGEEEAGGGRSLGPEEAGGGRSLSPEEAGGGRSLGPEEMDSCMMTPRSKRRSILVRMLRPVSVAFELEFDLDKALEEVPVHEEDPPPPPPAPASQPLDRMSLYGDVPPPPPPVDCFGMPPPREHQTLEHRTKLRPRPRKRTRPRQRVRRAAETNTGRLDEGLDDFFSKKVIRCRSRLPDGKATEWKAGRRSGVFNLRKSRTSRTERNHGAAAVSPPASSASALNQEILPTSSTSTLTPPTPALTPPTPAINSPTSAMTPPPARVESHWDGAESSDQEDSDTEKFPTPGGQREEGERKEEEKPLRLIGVPVMGAGLMAEMKARQERMGKMEVEKNESPSNKKDADGEAEDSRPEPAPRSNPPRTTPPSLTPPGPTPPGPAPPLDPNLNPRPPPVTPRPSGRLTHPGLPEDSSETLAASLSPLA